MRKVILRPNTDWCLYLSRFKHNRFIQKYFLLITTKIHSLLTSYCSLFKSITSDIIFDIIHINLEPQKNLHPCDHD